MSPAGLYDRLAWVAFNPRQFIDTETYLGPDRRLKNEGYPNGLGRRDAQVRLVRDNVVIHEGKIGALRRFKDDAREVKSGFECGIGLERFQDLKPGDEIEAYTIELTRRQSLESGSAS